MQRAERQVAQRIITAHIAMLHDAVDTQPRDMGDGVKEMLETLALDKKMLEGIPMCPWQPETPRTVISELFIPLDLIVLQFVTQRWIAP